jgi:DNA mismatch repair protein MutH
MTKLTVSEVENKFQSFDFSQFQKPGKNKGQRGQLIETALGIKNSSELKDLIDGELKSFTIGETIAVTQLKHCLEEIIDSRVEFDDSKVGKKLDKTIYIGFTRNNEYVGRVVFDSETDSEHYHQLADDYGYICSQIKLAYSEGRELNTIIGPNELLQIRTKASKTKSGRYTPMCYNGIHLKDKGMAFYLCSNFGKTIL